MALRNAFGAQSIRQKLLLGTLFLAIIPVAVTSVIVGRESLNSGRAALELIEREKVTFAGSAPASLIAMLNEKDLERYQKIFENTEFWKKLGQEHQNPLIVTGTVLFTNTQSSGFVTQNREIIDPLGRRVVQPYRTYMERKGFIIEPRFIFIDGRTGTVLYSDRFHEEILYPAQQQTPPL